MRAMELLLAGIVLTAGISDWRERRIPNTLSLGGALLGIVLNACLFGATGVQTALLGWLCGVVLLIVPYCLGGMGAGDVKLLGAAGAFFGPRFVFHSFLLAAVLGGIYAAAVLLYRRRLLAVVKTSVVGFGLLLVSGFKVNTLPRTGDAAAAIPYGVLIGISVVVFILLGG